MAGKTSSAVPNSSDCADLVLPDLGFVDFEGTDLVIDFPTLVKRTAGSVLSFRMVISMRTGKGRRPYQVFRGWLRRRFRRPSC